MTWVEGTIQSGARMGSGWPSMVRYRMGSRESCWPGWERGNCIRSICRPASILWIGSAHWGTSQACPNPHGKGRLIVISGDNAAVLSALDGMLGLHFAGG